VQGGQLTRAFFGYVQINEINMINVQGLTFTYAKAQAPALCKLHFEIARGEIFGFLGPSGAGKSTTQKILTGLLRRYQGEVKVFGQDLQRLGSDYYERVGVSFELPNHFVKLTALENLAYYRKLYSGKTLDPQDVLELVGLGPDGKTPVEQFSKGMKARLNVVRSLINDPELLFLDEPTAGLDPVNARRVKDLILAQKKSGKTIFLTTHNMSVAEELCDRVAFIVDGEIRLIDSPRRLKLAYGQPLVRVEFQANQHIERREFSLEGLGSNPEFVSLLQAEKIQTIHTQEASLEDIFIRVTGRSLL
jgi:fluoroquinolone transport system ATP-binding protein